MMLTTALLAAFLASAPIIGEDPLGEYYDKLREGCESATNTACCLASVREMRKRQAQFSTTGRNCPPGFRRASLRCPSSYDWCQYDPNAPAEPE